MLSGSFKKKANAHIGHSWNLELAQAAKKTLSSSGNLYSRDFENIRKKNLQKAAGKMLSDSLKVKCSYLQPLDLELAALRTIAYTETAFRGTLKNNQ
jgi:hypothetical protein